VNSGTLLSPREKLATLHKHPVVLQTPIDRADLPALLAADAGLALRRGRDLPPWFCYHG